MRRGGARAEGADEGGGSQQATATTISSWPILIHRHAERQTTNASERCEVEPKPQSGWSDNDNNKSSSGSKARGRTHTFNLIAINYGKKIKKSKQAQNVQKHE